MRSWLCSLTGRLRGARAVAPQPPAQPPAPAPAPRRRRCRRGRDGGRSPRAQIQRCSTPTPCCRRRRRCSLTEAQYGRFVTRLKALQETRRRHQQARNRSSAELRQLTTADGRAVAAHDEGAIAERLRRRCATRTIAPRPTCGRPTKASTRSSTSRQQARFRIVRGADGAAEARAADARAAERRADARPREELTVHSRDRSYDPRSPVRPSTMTAAVNVSLVSWLPRLRGVAATRVLVALQAQARRSRTPTRFQAKLDDDQEERRDRRGEGHSRASTQVTRRRGQFLPEVPRRQQMPVGIVDPTLHAAGNGRVTGRAIVDLDAVRTQKKRGWIDPLGYLTGAAGHRRRHADDAERRRPVRARVGGDLRRHRSRSRCCRSSSATTRRRRRIPAGIDMDDPFELPAAHPRDPRRPGRTRAIDHVQ